MFHDVQTTETIPTVGEYCMAGGAPGGESGRERETRELTLDGKHEARER